MKADLWLGVDTGGTYTDAVLLRAADQAILANAKNLTDHYHLTESLGASIRAVLEMARPKPKDIALVSISTTLATNAIVEGKGNNVCTLLIGYDKDMAKRSRLDELSDPYHLIRGGHDGHGEEKTPLDESAIANCAEQYKNAVDAFAISSIFSVRNNRHEIRAREIVQRITGLPVTCGHELTSQLDAPRRALTVALNARLIPRLRHLIEATRQVLAEQNIQAPLMVMRGDGSLLSAEIAIERPVETILSGPAASLIGMQFLSGLRDMIMSDIGGTTTDIAILQDGRPKLKEEGAEIGGYRTMVRAIDVHSYGLGGDSEIHFTPELHLGPKRVVPIALLADQYPEIINELARQLEDADRLALPARFVLRARQNFSAFKNQAERRLYESLPSHPVAVDALALGPSSGKALDQLASRGALILAGPTPSDALHVLGRQQNWSKKAAELAILLGARYHGKGLGAEAFAEEIVEQIVRESTRLLLNVAFDHPVAEEDFLQMLIRRCAQGSGQQAFVEFDFKLAFPLAAAGAGAAIYYPEIARRLNTPLSLSPYAGIANAIGAAIGAIVSEVEVLVTQPKPGLFRLHLGNDLLDCEGEALALSLAQEKATEKAVQAAMANGAIRIETQLFIDRKEFDKGRLFEAKVTARATSRLFLEENPLVAT